MDKKAIFEIFFKCNRDDEHKFNDFSQMTHAGKRIIFLVIHLALEGRPENWCLDFMCHKVHFICKKVKCGNSPLLSYPDVRGKLMFGYYVSL